MIRAAFWLCVVATPAFAQEPESESESESESVSESVSESESQQPETPGSDSESGTQQTGTHQVRVTSTPEGAALTIDGEPAGTAPTEVELAAGTHEVRGTLDAHQPDRRTIEVPAQLGIDLTLVPLVPQPEGREPRPASVLNYIFAATLLAAGVAVATGPMVTTIRAGECASSCDDPSEAERYEIGTQTVVWLSVSAALFAGALVFALARPIRASASVSRESASLTLQSSF